MSSMSTQNATTNNGPNTTDSPSSVMVGANQPVVEDQQRGKDSIRDSTAITAADDSVASLTVPPSAPHENISPDNLTESQFFVSRLKWSGSDAKYATLKEINIAELLDDEITDSFPAGLFLQTQGYTKFGMQFKVEVNVNRNAYGKLGVFYMPPGLNGFHDQPSDRRINGFPVDTLLGNDFNVQINLGSAASGSMTIPFMNILNCYSMPFTENRIWNQFCNNPGRLFVKVLNQLKPNPDEAAQDYASAQVFITGSLVKPWTAPSRRAGPIYEAPSLEFKFEAPSEKPVQQGLFDTIGTVAGEVMGGPAGAAVGGALGGVVDAIATAGQHSTDFRIGTSSEQTLNQFTRGDTRDTNILAPKPEDVHFLDNSYPEANEHIVRDVRDIAKRASRISTFEVEDTAPAGTHVWHLPLNYIFGHVTTDGVRLLEASPLTYVAMMYQYAQGSIELVIEQVGSRFTSSRLIACYNPSPNAQSTTIMHAAMGYSSVRMVFTDANAAIKIKVPYFNNLSWFQTATYSLYNGVPAENWGCIDVFTYGSQRGLAAETDGQPMQFNVYVMAGEDIDFAVPIVRALTVPPPYHYYAEDDPTEEKDTELPRQQGDTNGEVFVGSVTVPDAFYAQSRPVTRSVISGRSTDIAELVSVNTHVGDVEIQPDKRLDYSLPVVDRAIVRYLDNFGTGPWKYIKTIQPSLYNAITQCFYLKRGAHNVGFFANGSLQDFDNPRETLRINTTNFNPLDERNFIMKNGENDLPGQLWQSTTLQHNFSLTPNCSVVTPQLNATPWTISKIGRSITDYQKFDGQFIAMQSATNLSAKAQKFAMYQGAGPDFAVSFYLATPAVLYREYAEWYIDEDGIFDEEEKPQQQAGGDEGLPETQDFHKETTPGGVVINVGLPLDTLAMYPTCITCPLNQSGSTKRLPRPCQQVITNNQKFLNHLSFNHGFHREHQPFRVHCLACDEDIEFKDLRTHSCWFYTTYFCRTCWQEMDVHAAWRHWVHCHKSVGRAIIDKADDCPVVFHGGRLHKYREIAVFDAFSDEIPRQQSGGSEDLPTLAPFDPLQTIDEDDGEIIEASSQSEVFQSCEGDNESYDMSLPLESNVTIEDVGSDRSADFSNDFAATGNQQGLAHSFPLGERDTLPDNDDDDDETEREDMTDDDVSEPEVPVKDLGYWGLARSFLGDTIEAAREVKKATREARETGKEIKRKAMNLADKFQTTKVGRVLGISPGFILRWLDRLAYRPSLPRVCLEIFIDLVDHIPIPDDIFGRLCGLFQPNQSRARQNSLLSDLFAVGLPSLFAVACAALGKGHPFCKFLGVMTVSDALRSATGATVFARAFGSLIEYFFPKKTPLQEYVAANMEDFKDLVNLEVEMKEERNSINMGDPRIISRLRKIKPFLKEYLHRYHHAKHLTLKAEDKMAKLCEYALGRFKYFSERALTQSFPSPAVSYLVGGTGIGKTYLTQHVLPAYLTACEEEDGGDFQHRIFNWIPDQHSRIDGHANESILLLDDVGAIASSNGYSVFLQLASPGRKILPASDLDEKGIPIPIEGLVLTSNSPLPRPVGATSMEAFYRRIYGGGNAYVVAIREDVAKPDGTIDPVKAKGKHPNEVWAFRRFHWRGGEHKPTLTDEYVTFTDYVKKFYADLKANRATAADAAEQFVDLNPKQKTLAPPVIATYMQERLDTELNGYRDAPQPTLRLRRPRQQGAYDEELDADILRNLSEPGNVEGHVERLFNNPQFVKGCLGTDYYERDRHERTTEKFRAKAEANKLKLAHLRIPGANINGRKRAELDKFLVPHRDWKVPHSLRYTPIMWVPREWETFNFKKLAKGEGNMAPFGIRNHPMWNHYIWRVKNGMKTKICFIDYEDLPEVPDDYRPHELRWIDFFIPIDSTGFNVPIHLRNNITTVLVPLVLYAIVTYVHYKFAKMLMNKLPRWFQALLAPFLQEKKLEEDAAPPEPPTVVSEQRSNPIPKPRRHRPDDSEVSAEDFIPKKTEPSDQQAKYAATVSKPKANKMTTVAMAKQQGGGSLDINACRTFFSNMILMCDIQKGTVVQRGLGLKGSVVLCNLHYFKKLESGDPILIFRMNRKTLAWNEYVLPFLKERLHRRKLEKGFGDACYYELGEQVPYFRDLSKTFMTMKEFDQVRTKPITRLMMTKENNFGGFIYEIVGSPQFTFMTSYMPGPGDEVGSQEYAGRVMFPGADGMCGSPYAADFNGRPVIVGIHTAGTSTSSFFLPVFREEIEEFFQLTFIRSEEDYEATIQQSNLTQVEFHPEVKEFMQSSYTEVIERVPHFSKNKNDFTKTCMAPAIEEQGLLEGFGPAPQSERDRRIDPEMKKNFYLSVLFKGEFPKRENGMFRDRVWVDCVNELEKYYIPKIRPGNLDRDPMLSEREVLNGTDEPHSKGIDMTTSPGPGFIGPGKLNYFERETEDGPYVLKNDENGRYLADEVKRRSELYKQGIKPTAARYKYSTKPEIVRESKITNGKPRTFCAPDLATALIMKMVTGVFTDAFLAPHNSGIDANDSATGNGLAQLWQQISKYLHRSGLAYSIDYSGYDESIYVFAIDFYASFIIHWYKYWFGDRATDAQMAIIYTIIPSGIISKCEFRGYVFNQFFAHKSGFPNGHTIIFNWYVNGLNETYVYAKETRRRLESYHEDVKTAIMGDDKISILMDPLLKEVFNAQVLQRVLADEVKMKITAADKVSAVEPFDEIDQLEFLSHFLRNLGYTTDYSPALKKTSIWKLLAFVRRTSNLSRSEQIASNIREAVMNSAGWGEGFYDEICGFVNDHRHELAFHQVNVEIESYESILAKYYDIRT